MISVGRRDARKEKALSLGGGTGREVEETELEEGEACLYHNIEEGYASRMDPDIDSYIDEKLQNVLGHFQKDFEGGVSAENLGTKFGGYGSFLPTYQLSPVRTRSPKTPTKGGYHASTRSPNNLHIESGHRSSVSSTNGLQSGRLDTTYNGFVLPPESKTPSSFLESVKPEKAMHTTELFGSLDSKNGPVNRRNVSDQKILKVRIKMGSDSLLNSKNAAIYSGLGLDVSPSLEDSPSESEGILNESHNRLESPSRIIRMMTVFPLQNDLLMTPLSDDLILLANGEKYSDSGCLSPVLKAEIETSKPRPSFSTDSKKMMEKKTLDSSGTSDRSVHKRESILVDTDVDALACEKLVANTVKLPFLSDFQTDNLKMKSQASSQTDVKALPREKSNSKKKVSSLTTEDSVFQTSRPSFVGKVSSTNVAGSVDELLSNADGGSRFGEENQINTVTAEKVKSVKKKSQSLNQSASRKVEDDSKMASFRLDSLSLPTADENSDGKKKRVSKKQNNLATDALGDGSMLNPKPKKCSSMDNQLAKAEVNGLKVSSNERKLGDHYKDFFGESELASDGNQGLPERNDNYRPKSFDLLEKVATSSVAPKEKSGSKKVNKLRISDSYEKLISKFGANSTTEGIADGASVAPTSLVGKDSWVQCDKCQTWRILPRGLDPDQLPEKWSCSMMHWLPNMSSCKFTQDETTNAVYSLYQIPLPESQSVVDGNVGLNVSIDNVEDYQLHSRPDTLNGFPSVKKKHGAKELLNVLSTDSLPMVTNSGKKNIQIPIAAGNAYDAMPSAPNLKMREYCDLPVEGIKKKQKDKYKVHQSSSDIDDYRGAKIKVKKNSDQNSGKISSKVRSNGLLEDWTSNHEGNSELADTTCNKNVLHSCSVNDIPKNNDNSSSKDSSHDIKDSIKVSSRGSKIAYQNISNELPIDKKKMDGRDASKKRKMKERNDYSPQSKSGRVVQDNGTLDKDDFSESEHKTEKKSRVSRSDVKETSNSKGSGRNVKSNHKRNHLVGEHCSVAIQQNMDAADCLRRDSGVAHPSLAAASSSSKVSGSHKAKHSVYESKGSPVESVSSSPLRVSKVEKVSSDKHDIIDHEFVAGGGMKRCYDAEHDGRSDHSRNAKKMKSRDASVELLVSDYNEKTSGQLVGGNGHVKLITKNVSTTGLESQCNTNSTPLFRIRDEGRKNETDYQASQFNSYAKESSSKLKDKKKTSKSDMKNKEKITESIGGQESGHGGKLKEGRDRADGQNEDCEKKDRGQVLTATAKLVIRDDITGNSGSTSRIDAISNNQLISPQKNPVQDYSISGRKILPIGSLDEKLSQVEVVSSQKKNELDQALKKVERSNTVQVLNNSSRNLVTNGHKTREFETPNSAKKDSTNQAATNAIKEAKNLKHKADRLKSAGMIPESTRLYFEAALKFLHGASVLETSCNEGAKNGDMVQSMQMYSDTAKLCDFCAHEYEKVKDLAAAALAYKCTEVAFMRVISTSHNNVRRDRHELQTALQLVPPGESPSSSASDVDNLNHVTTDKTSVSKSACSPQVGGSHVIAARNRPSFERLLKLVQDVNFAMEASRKSRAAFEAASLRSGDAMLKEVKIAIDFSFQDVEGLLRLVRVAFDSISTL